jgi:hypothetical protein
MLLRLCGWSLLGGTGLIAWSCRNGGVGRDRLGGRDGGFARVDATTVDGRPVVLRGRVRIAQCEPAVGVVDGRGFEGRDIVGLAVRRTAAGSRGDRVDLERKGGFHARALAGAVADRRRGTRSGHDDPFLLVIRLGRDRGGGGASGNRKNAGGKQDAKATRPDRLRSEDAKQAILPANRTVGMKAKPIMVTGPRLMDVPDYHRTPPPGCRSRLSYVAG